MSQVSDQVSDFEAAARAVVKNMIEETINPGFQPVFSTLKAGEKKYDHQHFKINFQFGNKDSCYLADIGVYRVGDGIFSCAGYIRTNNNEEWKFDYVVTNGSVTAAAKN